MARRTPAGSGKTKGTTRNAAFRSAAEAFYSSACSTADPKAKNDYYRLSAECYEDAGEFLRAAEIYSSNQQYALARDGYERANKPHAAAVADAYHQREVARRTPVGPSNTKGTTRNAAFNSAADAFYSSACNTADPKAKEDYYRVSAECYEDAGEFLRAAEVYQLIEDHTKSLVLFQKAGKFSNVHQLTVGFADEIKPNALAAQGETQRGLGDQRNEGKQMKMSEETDRCKVQHKRVSTDRWGEPHRERVWMEAVLHREGISNISPPSKRREAAFISG